MTISVLGIITILVSIYAFFKNEKLLLYMVVFLSIFTAAELGHIELTTTPIQTFEFTGAIWLLKKLINLIKSKPKITKKIIIDKFKENRIALAFIFFIIAVILGEIALAVSGISIDYVDVFGEPRTVKFALSNITQPIIIIFMLTIMIALSFEVKTKEDVMTLINVFCFSATFAVIWGLLQFITYYFGIPYPDFLFNNNPYALQGYHQINNNIKRISSVALEPSMFSVALIAFLPFLIGTFLKTKINLKEKKHIILITILILTTVCAILTTSSTTYIGLVCVFGLFLLYILFWFNKSGELDNRKQNFIKIAIITVVSILIAGILCIGLVKIGYKLGNIKDIGQIETSEENKEIQIDEGNKNAFKNMFATLKEMTVDKLITGSAEERRTGEIVGLSMYKYSPVFGVGFGSYRTYNLFTTILVDAGIVGEISYLYILYVVIKELIKARKKKETEIIIMLISFIGMTLCFLIRCCRLAHNLLLDFNGTGI